MYHINAVDLNKIYTLHHVLIILETGTTGTGKKFICVPGKVEIHNKLSSFGDEIHEHTHMTSQLYAH